MPPFTAAHTPASRGAAWQSLDVHTLQTADLASRFGTPFGLQELARAAALLHDAGKQSPAFQSYLDACHHAALVGTKPPKAHLDHKSAGAILACEVFPLLAPVILGHHGGLPMRGEVLGRLKQAGADPAVAAAVAQARLGMPALSLPSSQQLSSAAGALAGNDLEAEVLVRMLFSCLVDADWLDTERHFTPDEAALRGSLVSLQELWELLRSDQDALLQCAQATDVNRVRREVYQACLQAASLPPGVFKLTVPTGGGKTRSSLAFAVKHALAHRLDRVIYAIPYTSIIEQTADVFCEIFGKYPRAVLEHHSAVVEDEGEDEETTLWRRLASENWDCPLVVTTTVQLFESLFAARPAKCRKVHNVARSVLVLDEVQTLPAHLLAPILDMLRTLVTRYGVTVVLCTATQPALEGESEYLHGLPPAREIVPDPERHFQALRELRRVEYRVQHERWTWERAAKEMRASDQCLAILNTKKDALALLDALGDSDALHLSTLLCGAHRRRVLKEVRERLCSGKPCRLVSTQVVEAGVDVDFPRVLRALGPLDRIVQAAGRCNREGRRESGEVIVFTPAEGGLPRGEYRTAVDIAAAMLRDPTVDLHSPAVFLDYFSRLFQDVSTDSRDIQRDRKELRFPQVAQKLRLIEEDTAPVLVPYDRDAVERLVSVAQKLGRVSSAAWREARQHSVAVRRRDLERWLGQGAAQEVVPGSGLYRWFGSYDRVRGLGSEVADPADLVV